MEISAGTQHKKFTLENSYLDDIVLVRLGRMTEQDLLDDQLEVAWVLVLDFGIPRNRWTRLGQRHT